MTTRRTFLSAILLHQLIPLDLFGKVLDSSRMTPRFHADFLAYDAREAGRPSLTGVL